MKQSAPLTPPKLDKPGAGLPFIQSLLLRFYLGPFVAKKADWNETAAKLDMLNDRIAKAIEGLSHEELTTKVLVPPQQGVEDSSRFWSIAMTIEHVTLVGEKMKKLIVALSNGQVPDEKVDTAKVKPFGTQSVEQTLSEFEAFRKNTKEELRSKVKDQNSRTTKPHPWFGPFNARQWHWLLASHSGIHYLQIKNIKKGLVKT